MNLLWKAYQVSLFPKNIPTSIVRFFRRKITKFLKSENLEFQMKRKFWKQFRSSSQEASLPKWEGEKNAGDSWPPRLNSIYPLLIVMECYNQHFRIFPSHIGWRASESISINWLNFCIEKALWLKLVKSFFATVPSQNDCDARPGAWKAIVLCGDWKLLCDLHLCTLSWSLRYFCTFKTRESAFII